MSYPLLPYMVAGELGKYVGRRFRRNIIAGGITTLAMVGSRKRKASAAALTAAQASNRAQRARGVATTMASKRRGRASARPARRTPASGNSVGSETSLACTGNASLPVFTAKLLKQTPSSYLYANAGGLSNGTPGIQ